MKKVPRKLKLSTETLRGLTVQTLLHIEGGISGMNIPDGCGPTNWWDCPSYFVQYACG
jgi:hypothetical protein